MHTHSDITHNHTQWLMEDTLAVGAEYTSLCSSSTHQHTVVRPNTRPRTHPADGVRSAISTLVSCGVRSATVPRCTVQRTHALAVGVRSANSALQLMVSAPPSVPYAVGVMLLWLHYSLLMPTTLSLLLLCRCSPRVHIRLQLSCSHAYTGSI